MHNFHCPSITNNDVIWFRPMPYEVSTAFKATEWCCYWSHQPYLMTSFDQALIIIPSFYFKSFACLKFNFWNTFKYTNANPPCIFSKSIHYTTSPDFLHWPLSIGFRNCEGSIMTLLTNRKEVYTKHFLLSNLLP